MAEVKIAYGTSDFKSIRKGKYLYVDKTRYIAELEKLNTKYPIFLRPRRFGKTMLVSTLSAYYDKNSADEFEELFGDTYIGTHKTELANQYYVLRFNFSGLSSESPEKLKETFRQNVDNALKKFIDHYQLDVDRNSSDLSEPASLLNSFLTDVYKYTGQRVFVLVDEYDHFANNIIGNREFFQEITGRDGFVRNFYEVFKVHTESGCIDRIFITGVTSMTLDSLTSGFNIAKNISMMAKLNEMVGFTEEETRKLLEIQEIEDPDCIMELLVEQYDGYRFCKNIDRVQRVLNSNLVLYFLDKYQEEEGIPDSLIDDNIRSDYDNLIDIFNLYQDQEDRSTILQDIMAGECVEANLVSNFRFSSSLDRDEFLSMLFYRGLLTVEGPGVLFNMALRSPNAVIREVYYDYYASYLNINLAVKKNAWEAIAYEDDFKPFNDMLTEILTMHSNEDYKGFNEARLKSVFVASFWNQSLFLVKSEYESSGRRIDIALLDPRGRDSTVKYNYLIELKYLKKKGKEDKKEVTKEQIQEARDDAWRQMTEYLELPEFQKDDRIKGLIYVVVKNKIVICEEVK